MTEQPELDGMSHQSLLVEQLNKFIKTDSYGTVHIKRRFSSEDREKN